MNDRGIRAGVRRLFRLPLSSDAGARADADEELDAFIEARVADLVARGATEAEARAEALRRLGGSTIAEVRARLRASATRRERRIRARDWPATVAQDLRFGARQLARARGISAIAVLTLGLGLGANGTIFALVHALLMRTLPVESPRELVAIGRPTAINGHTTGTPRGDLVSLPLYDDLRHERTLITGLAASGTAGRLDVRVGGGNDADEHPNGRFVSANYFDVLGVSAELGRTFGAAEDGPPGGSAVAVISDRYWRRRLGGAPDVVGARLRVDDVLVTVVGVARPGFDGDVVERPTEIWLPITLQPIVQPHSAPVADRGTCWLLLLGRLRPGVTLAQARARFTTLIRASLVEHAGSIEVAGRLRGAPVQVSSGAQGFSAARVSLRPALLTLQVGVGLLLLIVCTNLANLLVSRALTRQAEMSVRLALGAGRGRLVRQLMTESVLVALLGTVAGLGFAWWASVALARAATAAGESPVAIAGGVDAAVLAFTAGVSAVAVLCFGLMPAVWASGVDLASSMRAGSRSLIGAGRIRRIPGSALLVPVQVMLGLVLLTGAVLLTRSLWNLESQDPGFDRDHILLVQVDVERPGVGGERFMTLVTEVSARLATLPGVEAATYSQNGLFLANDAGAIVSVPGYVGRTQDDSTLAYDLVGPGYLAAIGARLLRGRGLETADAAEAPSVTVLNEAAARFFFGDADPIGRTIYFDAGVPTTIVGVVADIRDHSLTAAIERRAYAPYAQQIAQEDHPFVSFEVRTSGDPADLAMPVRRAIAKVSPELPQVSVSPVTSVMRDTIRNQRLVAALATAFGFAAVLLSLVGLYGVLSYAVTRRTAEIGLRAALGARRADLVWMVLGDGLRLAAVGLAAGVPLSLVAAHAVRAQLHGVSPGDPLSFGLAIGAVAGCALLATLVPAARAARVSPAIALVGSE